MIMVSTRKTKPKLAPKTVIYRSYKTFDQNKYRDDISMIPFSVCDSFEDPNDSLWAQQTLISDVLDDHAPLKKKKVRANQPAFMNNRLRKSIMNKTRLLRVYKRYPTPVNWERFRKQRNVTTSIRRNSIRQYFVERCGDGPKGEHFYKTIKPFLSSRYKSGNRSIMIQEGSEVVSEPTSVANSFNEFFANIATSIGNDKNLPKASDYSETSKFVEAAMKYHQQDQSIKNINEKKYEQNFSLKYTDINTVNKIIKNLNTKKATGGDNIPAKALTVASDILAPQLTRLFNSCVDKSCFPDDAKCAIVSPIYKKDDILEKKNYRPVSVLSGTSKVLEKIIETQMNDQWLPNIYSDSLTAFRHGYSCQHVILALCEKWRETRENKLLPGLLLVDLSKAFDCIPHLMIIAKLKAYGADDKTVTLLGDYLSNRRQRVKIDGCVSSWSNIIKGVPQGSIMGPIIFNLFINDIFSTIKDGLLFNYADDNSILVQAQKKEDVIKKLENNAEVIIDWCSRNQMAANPSKFQAMIAEEKVPSSLHFGVNTTIESEPQVKLLGIYLDNLMNFNYHVSQLIQKASRQLNCLKRTAYPLNEKLRLLLYKCFISSNFNYCPMVWHHCGLMNTRKLEKIQFRALKFVFSDYESDYDSLLQKAQIPTLEINRLRAFAIKIYKIQNDLSPAILGNSFKQNSRPYNLRSGKSFTLSNKRTTKYGLHSFQHFGITIWNSLPTHFRSATDLKTFKSLMKTWYGTKCNCAFCRH